jgi:hypothetical protein
MSVHHLGVLHKMIRDSVRSQYEVSKVACLEELQDYVKLNGDEMLSGRMHTTIGKLPQKEKDAMNETSLRLHFYEMGKKEKESLKKFRILRKTIDKILNSSCQMCPASVLAQAATMTTKAPRQTTQA